MAHRRSCPAAEINIWPAFVDVLATLLLVILLLVLVVTVTQFFTAERANNAELVGSTLAEKLADQVDQIQDLQAAREALLAQLNALDDQLGVLSADRDAALESAESLLLKLADQEGEVLDLQGSLADALGQMEGKLDRLLSVLGATEAENVQLSGEISALNTSLADLGERINDSLLEETEELQRQRSKFFGTLVDVLGERDDVTVAGDRFVFQSEVLFDSGSADLEARGQAQLARLAETILDIAADFPEDLNWILRIDGHTDARPIGPDSESGFEDNWQLSTSRARSVVAYLISQGVPPDRLTAAGFGEFQPLAEGDDPATYARNRRIEVKLTTR